MNSESSGGSVSEQLGAVIEEYLRAEASGEAPDRESFKARHNALAGELSLFFAEHDRMQELVRPFANSTAEGAFGEATLATSADSAPCGLEETIEPSRAGKSTAAGALGPRNEISGPARLFGDYELLREIARGGMGVVYKARQTKLNRVVALKMILAGQLASTESVRRFYAEAEAAANLDHPGVVPIYEVGEHNGQHYFSMGYIEGHSLGAEVAAGPLAPRRAAELTRKIAGAVAFAHSKGVVHRDLKPANILLDQHGEPKVTDFGLAKRVETESELTESGAILGTPSYMPPEQAAGKVEEIGPLSDVYSLGGILYCILTGRPPFQAARPLETLLQVLSDDPVPPRQLNPGVPRDLETITLKCLAKEPARRYASAEALALDLGRYLNDEPILARPAGAAERVWRLCRRNPWISGLAAAVVLSLVAGTIVSATLAVLANRSAALARLNESHARRETARANTEQRAALQAKEAATQAALAARAAEKIAEREKQVAQDERDRAQANLYPAAIQLAHRALREGNLSSMQRRLESQQPTGGIDHRGWEWYYLRGQAFGELSSFLGHSKYLEAVAWHPKGELVASTSRDGMVKIWNADSANEVDSWHIGPDKSCDLAWSAAGDRLLATPAKSNIVPDKDPRVLVWNLGSRAVEFSQPGTHSVWRPDGLRLAVAAEGGVLMWNPQSGRTEKISLPCAAASPLAFSPDGAQLAVADAGRLKLLLCDAATGEVQSTLSGHLAPISTVVFHPRLPQIATGSGGRDPVRTWDLKSGNTLFKYPTYPGNQPVFKLAWNKSGSLLAMAFGRPGATNPNRGFGNMLGVYDADGSLLVDHPSCQFSWSPTGDRLAMQVDDITIGIFKPEGKTPQRVLRGHVATVYALDWSPDGARLATGSADVSAKTWSTEATPEPFSLAANQPLAWQPKGRLLAGFDSAGALQLFDMESGMPAGRLNRPPQSSRCLAWSLNGSELAVGSYNYQTKQGELLVWNVSGAEPPRTLSFAGATSLGFDGDGRRLLTHGLAVYDPLLRVFDSAALRETAAHDLGRGAIVFAFSPASNRFAHSSRENGKKASGAVVVRNMAEGRELFRLAGLHSDIRTIDFDDRGNRLAVAAWHSDSQYCEITVWDLTTQEKLHSFTAHELPRVSLAFHPLENRLVSAVGKSAILWDLATGQELLALDAGGNSFGGSLAWSPDGRRLVANDGTLVVWDSTRGRERERPLPAEYFLRDVRSGGFF